MFTSSSNKKGNASLSSSIFGEVPLESQNSMFTSSDAYIEATEKRKQQNQDALKLNEKAVKKMKPEVKSREQIIEDRCSRRNRKESKELLSSITIPILTLDSNDEELNHGLLKIFTGQCQSIMEASGVLILNSTKDASLIPSSIMTSMQNQSSYIEQKICNKLDEKGIVYHVEETEAKRDIHACSTKKFDEVASRCLGRLDIRYKMSEEPFSNTEVVDNKILMSVVRSLLGNDAVLLYAGLILSFPSSSDQPWHQDGLMLFSQDELPEDVHLPAYALNVFIPLADVTEDMGPTEFSVGSHRAKEGEKAMQHILNQQEYKANIIGPTLKRGDALIYDYRICHRGTQNLSTDKTRPMLYLMYARPWFREHINFGQEKLFE
jgi:ectoine hydroxylase-related dioxygenase (phytanoyl-CoA dioxygenase family)